MVSSMVFELLLLAALIIIFIASFCGLLQKIRQTYEQDRQRIAEEASRANTISSLSEVYVNSTFSPDGSNGNREEDGVFPGMPPPYTELYFNDPPPTYEDLIKEQNIRMPHST